MERKIEQKKQEKARIVQEMTRHAFCELVSSVFIISIIISLIGIFIVEKTKWLNKTIFRNPLYVKYFIYVGKTLKKVVNTK